MKILVIGNGGREHALAWKLLQSPRVKQVICIPGNGGTATLPNCQNLSFPMDDFEAMSRFSLVQGVSLVVVGPELPLSLGITDYLTKQGLKVFGPTKMGAQLESSKSWAKELMLAAGVPTANSATFTDRETALAYVEQQGAPIVIKADGLAAGKGVSVAMTIEQAQSAINTLYQDRLATVVVEEYLTGQEVSVLALCDGTTIRPLIPAQDHKQIGEGDTGANTGGMGAYAPTPVVDAPLLERIEKEIFQPTLAALQAQGIDYRGVIYAGLMITPQGKPMVLEFNCRFGDPETQAILPLLETPLDELLLACVEQRLAQLPPLRWQSGSAVCVVTASQGYPGYYQRGLEITGIDKAEQLGATVFHAGTRLQGKKLVNDGGRVLGITAVGDNFEQAIAKTYAAVEAVDFAGMYYRRDIGHRIR